MSILALGLSPRTWPVPFVPELWALMTANLLSQAISATLLALLLILLRRGARRRGRGAPRRPPAPLGEGRGDLDDPLGPPTPRAVTYQCEGCSAVVGAYDRHCPRCGATFA